MRKRGFPLTPQEKWFIRNAAQIEKGATIKKIAGEIRRNPPLVGRFIRKEGLRTREQTMEAEKTALRSRHFPAHEQIPKIIELLQETKIKKTWALQI